MELDFDRLVTLSADWERRREERRRRRILRGRYAVCRERYHMQNGTSSFSRVSRRFRSEVAARAFASSAAQYSAITVVCVRLRGKWTPLL